MTQEREQDKTGQQQPEPQPEPEHGSDDENQEKPADQPVGDEREQVEADNERQQR